MEKSGKKQISSTDVDARMLSKPTDKGPKQFDQVVELMQIELNTRIAWSFKNGFRNFWK